MKQIVHFGFTDLAYCGYLLSGLHAEAGAGRLRLDIDRSLPSDVRKAAGGHENMQMISVFEASEGTRRMRFCVDNHDKSDFVHRDLLSLVDVYFKGNHTPETIASLGLDGSELAKIRPVGPPFAPLRLPWWDHRPPLTPVPEFGWDRRAMVRRLRQLRRLPTVDELRAYRSTEKVCDVVYAVRLYRQRHHSPLNEFRNEVGRLLVEHPDIDARVTFIHGSQSMIDKLRPSASSPVEYLTRLAGSRVGIYVWGAHRCMSFKLAEQLALGLPVIGQTIPQNRADLAGLKGFDEQFRYDDPVQLVEAVAEAVADAAWLARTAENNASVFDEMLAPEVVARNIVDEVFAER